MSVFVNKEIFNYDQLPYVLYTIYDFVVDTRFNYRIPISNLMETVKDFFRYIVPVVLVSS